jgi:hypothetical protein
MTDEDYEVMPMEHSLEQARRILLRLGTANVIADLEELSEGLCQDCVAMTKLFTYGRLELCRHCASSRARVAQQEAA